MPLVVGFCMREGTFIESAVGCQKKKKQSVVPSQNIFLLWAQCQGLISYVWITHAKKLRQASKEKEKERKDESVVLSSLKWF